MSFGTELRDKNGREFARYDRENYHFWGVISVDSIPEKTVRLFNIPAWVPIALFCSVEFGPYGNLYDAGGSVVHTTESGYHDVRVACHWNNFGGTTQFGQSFKRVNLYVFVQARYIPSSTFGFLVYAADGTVSFNSARPVLQVCGVTSAIGSEGSDGLTFFNRYTPRPAGNMGGAGWSLMVKVPGGQWYNAIFYRYVRVANAYVGEAFASMYHSIVPFNVDYSRPNNIALIDGAYYESFGSLGNFS